MQVTIIGTGNMARGIGSRVLAGGHDLTVVGKDSERAEAVAADIGGDGTVKTAVAGDPIEGVVVVLAVYYPDARAAAQQYAHQLAGNTTFAGPLTSGDVAGHKLDVLIAGDDGDAKGKVAALAATAGSTRSTWARCGARESSRPRACLTWESRAHSVPASRAPSRSSPERRPGRQPGVPRARRACGGATLTVPTIRRRRSP